jgi:hypothetical protein
MVQQPVTFEIGLRQTWTPGRYGDVPAVDQSPRSGEVFAHHYHLKLRAKCVAGLQVT